MMSFFGFSLTTPEILTIFRTANCSAHSYSFMVNTYEVQYCQACLIDMQNYLMSFFRFVLGAEFDAVGEISAVVLGLFHAFWAFILLGILLGALAAMAGLGGNKIIKGLRGGQ